jgi:hypothetical protein
MIRMQALGSRMLDLPECLICQSANAWDRSQRSHQGRSFPSASAVNHRWNARRQGGQAEFSHRLDDSSRPLVPSCSSCPGFRRSCHQDAEARSVVASQKLLRKTSHFHCIQVPVCGRPSTASMDSCLMPAHKGRSNRYGSHGEQVASHQPRSPANILGALGQGKQAVNQTTVDLKA